MAKGMYIFIGDTATPERYLKAGGVISEFISDQSGRKQMKRERVRIECMIDHYREKGRLDFPQCSAAYKFRSIYQRVNCSYDARILNDLVLVDGTRPPPDAKMTAYLDSIRELDKASKKLSKPQLDVIRKVCVDDRRIGNKDKLELLLRGLDKLAAHWGMK